MKRRPLGVSAQILLGFGAFILVIAALLWTFQIALLGPFYRSIQTAQVKAAAEQAARLLEDEDMSEELRQLCYDRGFNIVVTDELGMQYAGWKSTMRKSVLETMSPTALRTLFDEVNLGGGSRLQSFLSPYVSQDGSQPEAILYAKVVRTASGLNRMILIESEITPVDSVVDTLKIQLFALTAVMLVLGAVLAFLIARHIAKPIAAINDSANLLGQGQYDIRFAEEGSREVRQLATTLNYAAAELSKVEQLRRELLANVSHDLRTPLTMIQGYAEVMRDIPGENTPENVQTIIDETGRLTDLVNDLLDLSRLESGVVKLDLSTFDLTESIRTILGRYDKLADYSFPFYFAGDVFVRADELKISQVVYNLVNNAITYAGEDKTITLAQTVHNGLVRVSVTDTGEGIPPDQLKDIWERYYKVDAEHRRAQTGTGLGLSIVKNILDLHGGAYGVESRLGTGSTFWFELSLAEGKE